MPKYLVQVAMHREGIQNVLTKAKGTGFREAVTKFVESTGGRLEAYYFAFGRHDAVAIMDLPDNESAVAFSVAGSGSGAVHVEITPLVTPEEMDRAVEKSGTLAVPGRT
jgi:uncharacterized protein with GYD domain